MLRGSFNEYIGRQLFGSTAELARLAGWAAYDQEDHGLAHRYLIQALRLARVDQSFMSAKTAHCFRELGDNTRTAQFAQRSLTMSAGYQRGRAFNLSLLASALTVTDPREAVRVGLGALDIAVDLASRRSLSYLRDLRYRLRPFNDLTEVAEFRQQILELTRPG